MPLPPLSPSQSPFYLSRTYFSWFSNGHPILFLARLIFQICSLAPTCFWFLVFTLSSYQENAILSCGHFSITVPNAISSCLAVHTLVEPLCWVQSVPRRSHQPGLGQAGRCWNTWEAILLLSQVFEGPLAAFTLTCKNRQTRRWAGVVQHPSLDKRKPGVVWVCNLLMR